MPIFSIGRPVESPEVPRSTTTGKMRRLSPGADSPPAAACSRAYTRKTSAAGAFEMNVLLPLSTT
jgi:hypothetical protein